MKHLNTLSQVPEKAVDENIDWSAKIDLMVTVLGDAANILEGVSGLLQVLKEGTIEEPV